MAFFVFVKWAKAEQRPGFCIMMKYFELKIASSLMSGVFYYFFFCLSCFPRVTFFLFSFFMLQQMAVHAVSGGELTFSLQMRQKLQLT